MKQAIPEAALLNTSTAKAILLILVYSSPVSEDQGNCHFRQNS
jgi:hypothetical protein